MFKIIGNICIVNCRYKGNVVNCSYECLKLLVVVLSVSISLCILLFFSFCIDNEIGIFFLCF